MPVKTSHDDLTRFNPRETYGSAGELYDALGQEYWAFMFEHTLAPLDLRPGMRVLDAACGAAPMALRAAARVGPSGQVVAVDYGAAILDLARAKASARGVMNIDFRLADMTALAEPDESFDAVLCVLGLFFVDDMADLIRKLWRLVKPGGQLAITDVGPRLFEPLASIWEAQVCALQPDARIVKPWERANTVEIVASLLAEAGVPNADVSLERNELTLNAPDDWWRMVMGTGLRRFTLDLGDEGAAQVRAHNLAWIVAHGPHFGLDFIYARARKQAGDAETGSTIEKSQKDEV